MDNFEGSIDKNENITWYSCYLVHHMLQKTTKKAFFSEESYALN